VCVCVRAGGGARLGVMLPGGVGLGIGNTPTWLEWRICGRQHSVWWGRLRVMLAGGVGGGLLVGVSSVYQLGDGNVKFACQQKGFAQGVTFLVFWGLHIIKEARASHLRLA
jgi:hypothetical protein